MGKAPSKALLEKLREQRRVRKLMRSIVSGYWREVLLDMKLSQHKFPKMRNHSGKVASMLFTVDLIDLAIDWHATVFAGKPVSIALADGFEMQAASIEQIRQASLFDALLGEAIEAMNSYGESYLRATRLADEGVVFVLENFESCFPSGPDRADGQPTQWDRRWIIERKDSSDERKSKKYLRIQRHTAGMVEELAFLTTSDDVLQDENELTKVTLAEAIGPDAELPEESKPTGVPFPLIVRLLAKRRDGDSVPLLRENDIGLLDAFTASFTRLMRIAEKHADPRHRVPASMMDPKTKTLKSDSDVFIDPEKQFEAIAVEWDIEGMLELMNSVIKILLVRIRMSQALLGYKPDGGVDSDTYEKMKLGSSNTIAHAHKSSMYCTPALARLWFIASLLDALDPAKGHSVTQPTVTVHPQIPKDQAETAREQGELLDKGLTSKLDACKVVHGDQKGQQIYEQIQLEAKASADLAGASFSASFGPPLNTGDPVKDDANAGGGGAE